MDYDVVTVGGGLGGSALGWALACQGVRVLVLEREQSFKDRVRGEGILPWGVNEARDLGIYDLLAGSCGRKVLRWTSHTWLRRPARDLTATTPRESHCLNFYHPDMQEAILGAAEQAGATVRRGVKVTDVIPGRPTRVMLEHRGRREEVPCRLAVGADGRASKMRSWTGFEVRRDPPRLVIAGVLLEEAQAPDESIHVFRDSSRGEGALLFPLGQGRLRTYFIYRMQQKRRGFSGEKQLPLFLKSCRGIGVPDDWLRGARAAGPLAEFDGADTWILHPARDGVALVGDAASSNDPAWGNGLSLTLRDVRILKDRLLADSNWDRAVHSYAEAHDRHFGVINRVTGWLTDLLYEVGPEADARRDWAFSLMKDDRSRNPDYIALGPDSPSDEKARQRMFGEDQPRAGR